MGVECFEYKIFQKNQTAQTMKKGSIPARSASRLEASGHRFTALVEAIVTSPQFLNKRG